MFEINVDVGRFVAFGGDEAFEQQHPGRQSDLDSPHVPAEARRRRSDGAGGGPRSGWRWSAEGSISGAFPQGFRTVDVEFTHGYATAEVADVLAVVVSICRRVAAGGSAASGGMAGPIAEEHIGTYSYRLADTGGTLGSVDLTDTERDMLAQYRLAVIV